MSGQFHLDTSDVVLSEPAVQVAVYRYDPSGEDDQSRYQLVPNVVCERIEQKLGASLGPSTAQFRYVLDNSGIYPDWPNQFELIWPQTASPGPYVLGVDDRVVVFAWTPDGQRRCLFDGFAQIPQVNVDASGQHITIVATGVECRCWDTPIVNRVQRDIDDPETGAELVVDLPARFNPSHGKDGVIPNCTPHDYDVRHGENDAHPVFLDELIKRSPESREFWTISKAIRYITAVHNVAKDDRHALYVQTPSASEIDDLLEVHPYVFDDSQNLVLSNTPADAAPIRDFNVTNKCWPNAVEQLLSTVGFGCYFDLSDSDEGPVTNLLFYRLNGVRTPKTLSLAPSGDNLDIAKSNVSRLSLVRDLKEVVNAWSIETHPRRYEISVVLAPGFSPASGDGADRTPFLRTNLDKATEVVRAKYRRYIADETGDGHYTGDSWSTTALDLSSIFPDLPPGTLGGATQRTYVRRVRKGSQTLLTKDLSGKTRRAVVHWSNTYNNAMPALWDGTGDWRPIANGAWKLLDDCLGIELVVENPETISTGEAKIQLRGISGWEDGIPFHLMLTTVIDDDFQLQTALDARVSSPTKFRRLRTHDARDHYQFWGVAYPSWWNNDPGPPPPNGDRTVILRDDTLKAINLAAQYRAAHEMPPLAGSITIPWLTNYYRLGDRIKSIDGRNCDLRANTAPSQTGDDPQFYPMVVGRSYQLSGNQQATILHLSDLRANPHG